MPTGPKGQKRPADVIGNAVRVMRIATGEESDDTPDDGKSAAAKELGSKGGKKRAANSHRSGALRLPRRRRRSVGLRLSFDFAGYLHPLFHNSDRLGNREVFRHS